MQRGLIQNLPLEWRPFIGGVMGDEGVRSGRGRRQQGGAWMEAFLAEGGFHNTENTGGTKRASKNFRKYLSYNKRKRFLGLNFTSWRIRLHSF